MTHSSFLIKSRHYFPHRVWHWLILALNNDTIVWDSLGNSEFSDLAFEKLPALPEKWTPASLSLLALGEHHSWDKLRSSPMEPISNKSQENADTAYEEWINTNSPAKDLSSIGLIALALREFYRNEGTWDNLIQNLEPIMLVNIKIMVYGPNQFGHP